MILPDWAGRVTRAFGLHDTGRVAAVVAVDGEGRVAGMSQGGDPALTALDLLRSSSARGARNHRPSI